MRLIGTKMIAAVESEPITHFTQVLTAGEDIIKYASNTNTHAAVIECPLGKLEDVSVIHHIVSTGLGRSTIAFIICCNTHEIKIVPAKNQVRLRNLQIIPIIKIIAIQKFQLLLKL